MSQPTIVSIRDAKPGSRLTMRVDGQHQWTVDVHRIDLRSTPDGDRSTVTVGGEQIVFGPDDALRVETAPRTVRAWRHHGDVKFTFHDPAGYLLGGLPWLPEIVRRPSGMIWCMDCDGPLVNCGAAIHA